MKIKALFKLTRFDHGLMLSFAVLLTYIILGVNIFDLDPVIVVISLLIPILIEMGAFALNDYLDYPSDVLNKREDRPLVTGEIGKDVALYIFMLTFVLSAIFALSLPTSAFYIVISFAFLSIAYDIYLKHLPLIGNMVIALSMGIPFIFANSIVSDEIQDISLILFGMAFVLGLAREIIKDIEDIEGDRIASSSKTFPIIVGIRFASLVSGILLIIFMIFAIIPFLFYFTPTPVSLFFLIISYGFIGYSAGVSIFQLRDENYKYLAMKLKKNLLLAMLFGLVSLAFLSLGI